MRIIHGFYMVCVYYQVANNFTNNNSLRIFQAIDVAIPIIQFNFYFSLVIWVSTFNTPILDSVFHTLFFSWKRIFKWILHIVNDDQQNATFLAYSFIPNQLYIFQAMSSLIIRSTWLYLQHLILSTVIVAGWCHEWDGTEFHLIHDTSKQQYRWTISDAVNTVKCSWWWAKTSPERCRAD